MFIQKEDATKIQNREKGESEAADDSACGNKSTQSILNHRPKERPDKVANESQDATNPLLFATNKATDEQQFAESDSDNGTGSNMPSIII